MSSQKPIHQPDSPEQIGNVMTRSDIEPLPIAPIPRQVAESALSALQDDSESGSRGSLYMPTAAEANDSGADARSEESVAQCKRCHSWDFWEVRSLDGVLLLQCVSCRALYRMMQSR
jgi:hypothetical protein